MNKSRRLQGIDAPERKQPFGERARQALAELIFQKRAAHTRHGIGAGLHASLGKA
ncbi:thermonuclease family protein [Comamonas testosteroni]|uniref:thermonuclease family protein n=1 Tax=Comamonas testosteroni TaxID=285 RepID=UPI0039196E87